MKKEILYKYAEDNNGNIIYIDKVESGINYYCPSCKKKFKFRNGEIRQRHFAHNIPSPNCTAEGYLHKTFKKLLLELLNTSINQKLPIEINWECNICKKMHNGNLLNGILDVKAEYDMGVCRPDIALFNEIGETPIVIEIVDTHEPEFNAVEHYKKNGITLIKIKVDSLNDLENIENKIKYSSVYLYNFILCPSYRRCYVQNIRNKNLFNNRINIRKQTIDEIEKIYATNKRKQYYAIKRNYAKNGSKKR
ncbi:MAG: hypothetical protein Ta2B_16500 [Termitinemataceae bacterium]|nr:MAG: hypothetical protein Ta2B_16500 [Termitinemataceae bacterium]